MVEECTDDRIPQEQAAEILDSVIRVRKNYEQFEKLGDVNALMRLLPVRRMKKMENRCCSISCRRIWRDSPTRMSRISTKS